MALLQAQTCSILVKATICIKINLCCVRVNKCGLFSNELRWMASTEITPGSYANSFRRRLYEVTETGDVISTAPWSQ